MDLGQNTPIGRCPALIPRENLSDGVVYPVPSPGRREGVGLSISSSWDLASDAELITAVRSGETAAFGVLGFIDDYAKVSKQTSGA